MTEPEVTLKDVWQLLCSMDQSINERFDRIERLLDAQLTGLEGLVAARDVGIGAQLRALTPPPKH